MSNVVPIRPTNNERLETDYLFMMYEALKKRQLPNPDECAKMITVLNMIKDTAGRK